METSTVYYYLVLLRKGGGFRVMDLVDSLLLHIIIVFAFCREGRQGDLYHGNNKARLY